MAGFQTALPRFVTGLVFLSVAYVAIKLLLRVVRASLNVSTRRIRTSS